MSTFGGVGPSRRGQVAAAHNSWLKHVAEVKHQHPDLSWGQVAHLARQTYTPVTRVPLVYKLKDPREKLTKVQREQWKQQTMRRKLGLPFDMRPEMVYAEGYPRPTRRHTLQKGNGTEMGGVAIYSFTGIVSRFLAANKQEEIYRITLCRSPIEQYVSTALNILTLGQFRNAQQALGYDQMYHVFALLYCKSGKVIFLEKNQTILMGIAEGSYLSAKERFEIPEFTPQIFGEMLQRTREQMGTERFFDYRGYDWNCQDFLLNFLSANGISSADAQTFLYQNASAMFDRMAPVYRPVTKFITDLAGIYDHFTKK